MSRVIIRNDRHYTYADYLRFPEDERWEIIDGVAYQMAPAPTPRHQSVVGEMYAQVLARLRGKPCRVLLSPVDVRFKNDDRADTVVQPDLVVICDRSKIIRSGIVGAPDWTVEVLSPSTAGKDQIKKRALYERHGVREFWLVHPVDRVVTIYRSAIEGRFSMPETREMEGVMEVAALPRVTIDWSLLEPLSDDAE